MGLNAKFYIVETFYAEEAKELASKMHFSEYVKQDDEIQVKTQFLRLRDNWPVHNYFYFEGIEHNSIDLHMDDVQDMYNDVEEAVDTYDTDDFWHMGFKQNNRNYDGIYYSKIKELRDGLKKLLEIYDKAENKSTFYVQYTYW